LTQFAHAEETALGDVAEAMARRILNEAAKRAEAGGARRVHTVLRAGACAEQLVAPAREGGAKAIFVGRPGTGGCLAQALIGSVSQKLAAIAPINLVIVP
jgi:nucleotide-binding universal stress UspA family protein